MYFFSSFPTSRVAALGVALLTAAACNRSTPAANTTAPTAHAHALATATDPHAGHAGMQAGASGAMPSAAIAHGAPTDMTRGHRVVITTDPPEVRPNVPVNLLLDPQDPSGTRVTRLAVVHEKLLHFIMVSRDLSFFAHEHPVRRDDGTLALRYTFPAAGEYVLFSDFTPEGGSQVVAPTPLRVAGTAPPAVSLVPDADLTQAKTFGTFSVTMTPTTREAGRMSMLSFAITRGGAAVTDLRPYLGALGHCVIISEDTTAFLHSHPMEQPSAPGTVMFHTTFPRPGRYKIWAEFRPAGETLLTSYIVEVTAPSGAPAPSAPAGEHGAHAH